MRASLLVWMGESSGGPVVDGYVEKVRAARDDGFDAVWTPQLPWEPDVLVGLAVALREVEGVIAGTAVLPIQSRLPMVMAQQALTLSLLSGGRFRLGIGLTHRRVAEQMWGVPWERPVRHLDEYLDSLLPLLAGESVRSTGEIVTTRGALRMPGAAPPPVYVAALGPQLLSVAGRRAAGTITWMTGPRTLASHIGPGIRAAAHRAGRSVEVVAIVPVCVTDDPERARAVAAERYAPYNDLPSYRAMLDREGAGGPEDVAVVGHEEAVRRALATLDAAGVDEVVADVFGSADEMARTRALLLGTVAAAGNGGRRPGSWT